MPPKTPGAKPKTPPAPQPAAAQAEEDALLGKLAEKQFQLDGAQDKLTRLETARAVLDGERAQLGTQLTAERTQFGDINSHLKHALEEQRRHADALESQLKAAQAQLAAAAAAAAADADAAEQRRQADVAQKQAQLDEQHDKVQQAEAFLAERDALRAKTEQLLTQLEEEKRQHHKRHMDMERKHAADRELWRRDTQEAVRAAREEMAALTDQRLDATTKQTICENEAMAGELQYQGRHLQAVLARNSALQKEAAELRLALGISRGNEEELARKALACEKAADSLLARLDAVEAQRAEGQQAVAELHAQLQAAREEVRVAALRLEDQACHVAELEQRLKAKRQELKQLRDSQDDAANFLLLCMADARQELLAEQGHAALAAAAVAGGSVSATAACCSTAPPEHHHHQHLQQQQQPLALHPAQRRPDSSACCPPSTADAGEHPPVLLSALSMQQREAVLQRLLQRLQVDWRDKEGLVLPASPSRSAACCAAKRRDEAGPPAGLPPVSASPGARPAAASLGEASSRAGSGARGLSVPSMAGAASSASSSELMQALRSEVRPWGSSSH